MVSDVAELTTAAIICTKALTHACTGPRD